MTGIIVGGLVVLVVVVIAAMLFGGDTKTTTPTKKPVADSSAKVDKLATPTKKDSSMPAAKAGTEPTVPAPALSADLMAKTDANYRKAKKMNDDGRRAQSKGNNKEFNKLINDSWDTLELILASLEANIDWLDEAELEGWRVPPAYVKLQQRLGIYLTLRGRLHRVKTNRQK